MKAVRLHEPTGTDALHYETVPRPDPDPDELLVRVHAAGVNPLDWLLCDGVLPELRDRPCPWTPGWDVSGTVTAVGDAVTDFDKGDPVFGMTRPPGTGGGFAEYVTVTTEEVTAKPDALTHVGAAGVPMAGQTAMHALSTVAGVDSGQRVLVHAAAGGVGHFAVQLASNAGAHVVGTASGRNEAYLRALGVDEFVDYRDQQFEARLDDVDVVLDAIGGDVLERSIELTRPGGVVVTLPEQPPEATVQRAADSHDVDVSFFDVVLDSDPGTLERLSELAAADALEPTVSDTYPLSRASDALEENRAGHVRGKLVLDVRGDGDAER